MGFARLAREEYAWARRAFNEALALDPDHEDALAGLGETLLQFGERAGAVACFERILTLGFRDDHDLMLQIGRALFRESVLEQARRFFEIAVTSHADSAEAAACVGYAAHRLTDEGGALYWLRRALELDPAHGEARIYLANLLYDRGLRPLFHLERTEPEEHFDGLGIWRLMSETEHLPAPRRRSEPAPERPGLRSPEAGLETCCSPRSRRWGPTGRSATPASWSCSGRS
jgi:tetratricopeptide (TPR) repeat protein